MNLAAALFLMAAAPVAQPLEVQGTRFNVPLRGAVICCAEAKDNGWPLISDQALRRLAEAGANWTHVRLGPYPPRAEGPDFAAYAEGGAWNPGYWERLRRLLGLAASLGIYVELDVVDAWALEHGRSVFGDCSTARQAPQRHHLKWIRKVVAETADFPNVVYQIGNETFGCRTRPDWELGVRDALRAALGERRRLIGTNSHDPQIEREVDYVSRHADQAQAPGERPIVVNETGSLSPRQFREQLAAAERQGTYFVLWRGSMNARQWKRALGFLQEAAGR